MTTPLRVDLVDISHWQDGPIDWAAAKRANIQAVFIKCTEGNTYSDPLYGRRRAEAFEAGLPSGPYHFARPQVGDAVAEARFLLAKAGLRRTIAAGEPRECRVMLDLEDDGQLSTDEIDTWVETFGKVIYDETGIAELDYIAAAISLRSTRGRMLWAQRYSNSNAAPYLAKPWTRYGIRQFSNGVYGVPNRAPGFGDQRVDLNTFGTHDDGSPVTVEDLYLPLSGSNPDPDPEPKPTPHPNLPPFDVITANIKSNPLMSRESVLSDVRTVAGHAANTGLDGAVIGWQEMDGKDYYQDAVKDLKRYETYTLTKGDVTTDGHKISHVGLSTPISWRTPYWRFIDARTAMLMDATAHIGYDRICTRVTLANPANWRTKFINVHPPNRKISDEAAELNAVALKLLRAFVTEEAKDGAPIVLMGDMNLALSLAKPTIGHWIGKKPDLQKVTYMTEPGRIDQIALVDSGVNLVFKPRGSWLMDASLRTDHKVAVSRQQVNRRSAA